MDTKAQNADLDGDGKPDLLVEDLTAWFLENRCNSG